ncbi:MAG: ethanolamine utilization protein EutH [Clostridia bacterium]|nr:ethanolamine utilization protein EutH [Clostridia bacterium]
MLELIFGIFALLGALDRITGNHLKIGEEFEKGILSVGTLAVAMVGMITIAPTLANLLTPACSWLSQQIGIDSSFLGGFVANDMGGASIAVSLSQTPWSRFHGLVVAAMMGVTICFTIPVALKMVKKEYHQDMLTGILCGVATVPLGCVASGLFMEFSIGELLLNLLPVIFVSLLTCLGLVFCPGICRKVFEGIGNLVLIIITVGLAAGIFTHLTGYVLIPGMAPVTDGFMTVVSIAMILAGVFPLISVLSKILKKPFGWIGNKMGMNEDAVVGLLSSLANSIPTFTLIEKMNSRGIIINMAFVTSASFVLGDHLAFTMAFDGAMIPAMVIGKLTGGLLAVVLAVILCNRTKEKCASIEKS